MRLQLRCNAHMLMMQALLMVTIGRRVSLHSARLTDVLAQVLHVENAFDIHALRAVPLRSRRLIGASRGFGIMSVMRGSEGTAPRYYEERTSHLEEVKTSFRGRRQVAQAASASALAVALASLAHPAQAADFAAEFLNTKPDRTGLKAPWLEKIRAYMQDTENEKKYGGELAPGGPPSRAPELQLVPIVQMQKTIRNIEPELSDQSKWNALYTLLDTGYFDKLQTKKVFNAYSDNIYYRSDSQEANAGLLGGTTPSTQQTLQYGYRNDILEGVEKLKDEIRYQQGLNAEKRDLEYLREIYKKTVTGFDDYLALAKPEDLKSAREVIYGAAAATTTTAAAAAVTSDAAATTTTAAAATTDAATAATTTTEKP